MKRTLLSIISSLLIGFAAQAQIVITEIMYNPPESGTDSLEFIEVLNNSNAVVNMTGWSLEFGNFAFTIPTLSLGAGQYQVFSVNAAAMQNNFGVSSIQWTSGALSNNGTSIRIKNAAGAMIDTLTFDDIAPWPTDPDGLGPSLVLCDPNADNNQASSWIACTTPTGIFVGLTEIFANPGAASGCVSGLVAEDDDVSVLPGTPTLINVLSNDNVPGPVTAFTITNSPQHGNVVVQPDNSVLYTPANGYCGPDNFSYQVCDGPNSCAVANVFINVKCYPQRTIGEMNNVNLIGLADSVNVSCELTGTVYGVNLRASGGGLQFVIMNDNGTEGISTFSGDKTFGYAVQEGDKVVVRGTIAQFSGLTQINMDTVFKQSASNPLVSPTAVLKADESTENRLIRINNLRLVDAAQWTPGMGPGFNVRVYSPFNPSDTIVMRIDNDVDLYNQASPPAEPFDLVGLGGQFDGSVPYLSGYQVLPRYTADILTGSDAKYVDYSAAVRLAPNPVVERLLIQTDVQFDRILIYGLDGTVIRTIDQPQLMETVEMSAFPNGVYAVHFIKGASIWATAIVKQ